MKAEIIAVGTELLLGQIVNTNAQFLSQQFAHMGIDLYFQTVVGDNAARLRQSLDIARGRADLILLTGGLGPTQDDLTKEVVAELTGKPLVIHQPTYENIKEWFKKRGMPMSQNNIRQAYILEGSDPLPNDTGMAVGVALTFENTHFVLLPGPPKEMKPMFERYAVPWIRRVMNEETPLFSKMLKFAGIGESSLEHSLLDLIENQKETSIAPYAKEGEVLIRLSTKAENREQALAKMAPLDAEIRRRVGQYLFAEEDVTLEETVVKAFTERGWTLSAAESCTGGLLSDLLTSVPGSSRMFSGGVISYSNALKEGLLNVPREVLEGPGAISEEAAVYMAEHLLRLTGTDFSVSVTGNAGPGAMEGKPVGLVYVGIARKGAPTVVKTQQFAGSREIVKLRAAKYALYQLWRQIRNG